MKPSQKRLLYRLIASAAILLCFIIISRYFTKDTKFNPDNQLTVHFLDVGQGSSALIELNGHYMLFDGGDRDYSSFVVSYLDKQGVETLDYVIASHYDADHINGVVGALTVYDTKLVLAPDYTAESRVYKSFVSVIEEKKYKLVTPSVGDTYELDGCKFTIISPVGNYDDSNNKSIGIKLTYGDTSFIIMGDAEKESEKDTVETGLNLKADVYAVNHHGSSSSSSEELLKAISPEYAIISCGKDNSYGHPTEATLNRLKKHNIKIYRTDLEGTIIAKSDGTNIAFSAEPTTENTAFSETYIGNVQSKKFHLPTCIGLPDKENRIYFSSRELAVKAGYTPCGICNP